MTFSQPPGRRMAGWDERSESHQGIGTTPEMVRFAALNGTLPRRKGANAWENVPCNWLKLVANEGF